MKRLLSSQSGKDIVDHTYGEKWKLKTEDVDDQSLSFERMMTQN